PVVMTVPFVASNPLALHTSWSGNTVTLKGTMSSSAPLDAFVYDWNPGDGGTHCSGNVTIGAGPQVAPDMDSYGIECQHVYTGPVNTVFTATLTVTDTTAPGSPAALATYQLQLKSPPPNLPVEVNNA